MMACITKLTLLKKAMKQHPNSIIITERSLFTDKHVFAKMLYDDHLLDPIQYIIYMAWFNEFISDIRLDGIIYLKTEPAICMDRIMKRGRAEETDIHIDYLIKCHDYHNQWILEDCELQKLIINSALCMEDNVDVIIAFITKIGTPSYTYCTELYTLGVEPIVSIHEAPLS